MALEFVHSNSEYIQAVSSWVPGEPGTLCFWYTPIILPAALRFILAHTANFNIRTNGSTLETVLYRQSNKPTSVGTALTVGVTTHITCVWKQGTKEVNTVWYDAVQVASTDDNRAVPASDQTTIGWDKVTQYLDATLEDFRFYNRELSLAEIQTIYSSRGVDGITDGLVSRWSMNEGAEGAAASGAGSVKDLTGVRNMTPNNSPTYEAGGLRSRRRVA
jgi:hypothetical protein